MNSGARIVAQRVSRGGAEVRGGAENCLLCRVFRAGAVPLSIHISKCNDFGVGIQPFAAPRSCSVLRDQGVRVVDPIKESDPLIQGV